MMRNLFVTVLTHLFLLTPLLLNSKNRTAHARSYCRERRVFVAGDEMAGAATVTTTVQGTMLSGTDTGTNGQGVFGPAGDLTGKPFTLVYTFDDTQGQQYNTVTQGGQPTTGIKSTSNSFPGSAVLTINGVSVQFGAAGGSQVPISYEDK